jgi:dienelactone hydrolase
MSIRRLLFVFGLVLPLAAWAWGDPTVPVEGTKYEAKLNMFVKEDAKRGTVLVLNGCNGPRDMHYTEWAKYLNEIGYNAIVVNSFDTRGLRNICPVRGNRSYSYDSVPDAISVAHWVKKQEWSNGKVDAIGFSLGGITTLTNLTKHIKQHSMVLWRTTQLVEKKCKPAKSLFHYKYTLARLTNGHQPTAAKHCKQQTALRTPNSTTTKTPIIYLTDVAGVAPCALKVSLAFTDQTKKPTNSPANG